MVIEMMIIMGWAVGEGSHVISHLELVVRVHKRYVGSIVAQLNSMFLPQCRS